jgi:hypothetical protein
MYSRRYTPLDVPGLFDTDPVLDETIDNQLIQWDTATGQWIYITSAQLAPTIDHNLLNNLDWSDAGHVINDHILPNQDTTRNLGSASFRFGTGYFAIGVATDLIQGTGLTLSSTGSISLTPTTVVNFNADSQFNTNDLINVGDYTSTNGGITLTNGTLDVGGISTLGYTNVSTLAIPYDQGIGGAGQIVLGASGLSDATIGWDSSGYLDIQSADTRFSGTIAIPTTADADTGVIEQPGGTRFIHTFGTNNLFIGSGAGTFGLTVADSTDNVALGQGTLLSLTTGSFNFALGSDVLRSNSSADSNVGIGRRALYSCTTGPSNMAIGTSALRLMSGATGRFNVAIGTQSLERLTSGTNQLNCAIGYQSGRVYGVAGTNLTDSQDGVYIGAYTSASANSADNQIVIGAYAIGKGDDTVVIGSDGSGSGTAIKDNYLTGTVHCDAGDINGTLDVSGVTTLSDDLIFDGAGKGLSYGSLYTDNTAIAVTPNIDTDTVVDGANALTAGLSNRTTITDPYIEIDEPGVYLVNWSLSLAFNANPGAVQQLEGMIMVDPNTGTYARNSDGTAHRSIGNNTDEGNMGGTALIDAGQDYRIALGVRNDTAGAKQLNINHYNLTVTQIGGT